MTRFRYDPAILNTFPQIVGGIIDLSGLRNGPTPDSLRERYFQEQAAVLQRLGETPLSEVPSLAAWRGAFRKFGVDPTQYRSAAEALLRRLTKKGDIPSINTLVDIGNLVSIRYALPVAVFDRRSIAGELTVRFADGTEQFTNLGQSEADRPEAGEVIFADEARRVAARRWCWRQSEESGAREDTTNVLITVEGHHEGAHADAERAVADLLELLRPYHEGPARHAVLDAAHPAF